MKFLSQRPDLIYWATIPVVLAVRILFLGNYILYIQLYDTYYVTEYRLFSIIIASIMMFFAIIYSFFRYANIRVISAITVWQILLTVGGTLTLTLIFLFAGIDIDTGDLFPRRYYSWTNFEGPDTSYSFIICIAVALMAIVLGFLLMILNLVLGLIRRLKVQ